VFDKIGVRTRRELIAAMVTQLYASLRLDR
jgi:hypothetical protein